MSKTAIITYEASVYMTNIPGFRGVEVQAKAELNKTGKMGEIIEVLDVKKPASGRKDYNVDIVAEKEIGKRKRISACASVK